MTGVNQKDNSTKVITGDDVLRGTMASPVVMDTFLTGKKTKDPTDTASFVIKAGGLNHTILMRPTLEQLSQVGGERTARLIPIPNSGRKIRFAEGAFLTDDQEVVDFLLSSDEFGMVYDINRHDPTGYWQKNASRYGLVFDVQKTVTVTGDPKTVLGAMTRMAMESGPT